MPKIIHNHLLAHVRRKAVQLSSHRIEEAQLLRLVLDLNLLQEQQGVDQVVLKETIRLTATRYNVRWIRSACRIGANQFAVQRCHRFWDLRYKIMLNYLETKITQKRTLLISFRLSRLRSGPLYDSQTRQPSPHMSVELVGAQL